MAQVVASYQQSAFSTPINGATADASVVLANDNNLRTAYNNHDADPGVHLQSSTLASRPAASAAGRKWLTTDGLRIYFDTGSVWSEVAYLPLAGGTMANTTVVTNLNADLFDGQEGTYYRNADNINAGTLVIARGGTGVTTTPTNGQLLIGNGSGYTVASVTQGDGITIGTGAGTLSITGNVTGGTGITVTPSGGALVVSVTAGAPNTGAGTANKIVKYTGANTQGNADLDDAGAGVITSGSRFAPLGVSMTVKDITFNPAFSPTISLTEGSVFDYHGVSSGTTLTINSPGAGVAGQVIHFMFRATGGVGPQPLSWNAIYKGTPLTSITAGNVAAISYISNGTNWIPLASANLGYP